MIKMNVLCFVLLMAIVIFMYTKMVIAVLGILISVEAPIWNQILHPHQQKYCLREVNYLNSIPEEQFSLIVCFR
jgi:hypothetical protein